MHTQLSPLQHKRQALCFSLFPQMVVDEVFVHWGLVMEGRGVAVGVQQQVRGKGAVACGAGGRQGRSAAAGRA